MNRKNNHNNVSINILHYNSYKKTKMCVNSCLNQIGDNIKIIIIDNNSTNDSLVKLKKTYQGIENILFLENNENCGFARGHNLGVKYAFETGIKYSLLLNNDTEVIGRDLVSKMLDIILNFPKCAVVAPRIYDVTKNGLVLINNDSWYLSMLRFFKIIPRKKCISKYLELISEAQGSAIFVNNEVFLEVKGFPEHYFMYGEEGTFSKKILWYGKQIIWFKNEDCYILHHHDKSSVIDGWRLYLMGRNRGLEYYENRDKRVSWRFVYLVFWIKCILQYKKNYQYLQGMKKARKLKSLRNNYNECYLDGYMAKEVYGSKKG